VTFGLFQYSGRRHGVCSDIDRGDEIEMPNSKWRRVTLGAALAAVAASAFYGAHGLSIGTAIHAGPGLVPTILAALLFILGLLVAIKGLWQRPIDGEE
jgi:hypothetical protein